MVNRLTNLDLSLITFVGLSKPFVRLLALISTLSILLGLSAFGVALTVHIESTGYADIIGLSLFIVVMSEYIFTDKSSLINAARYMADQTPIAVLYRKDRKVLELVRAECLSIASEIDFEDYKEYARCNISIGKNLPIVISHQEINNLKPWISNINNLRLLACVIYEIHATEILMSDIRNEILRSK